MKAIKLLTVAVALSSGVAMANNIVVDAGKTTLNTLKNPAAVSLELGTLGAGANVSWSANETAEVVVGWTGGKVSTDIDLNDNDSIINWNRVLSKEYEEFVGNVAMSAEFNNPYVGVKVRPFANRFTVGTGVIFQRNDIDVKLIANESTTININGKSYAVPTSGEVGIHAESGRSLAPYLTVGFKPNSDKRFGMFGEVGAVYTGDWKTSVVVSDSVAATTPELQGELEKKIQDSNLAWYPIVKLGATVRF